MVSSVSAKVLEHVEDLDGASPGLYVVRSGTDAYFPVKGLINLGEADQLGEYFDEYGDHVITIGLKKSPEYLGGLGSPINPPRTIRIGSEFFVGALKEYDEWQTKWWREAVQNSVDAGATVINLAVTQNTDGSWLISCEDNGRGMDEDTIVNKFLVLGGTTKISSSGAAGGFGKAKELLLLPWIAWKIHSRDRVVEGSGIDYSISPTEFRQGTLLEVLMPADKTTSAAAAMAFVQKCYLPHVAFTVDGKAIYADLKGERLVEEAPEKAEIYFTPGEYKTYQAFVRARGLYMFTTYVGDVPGRILIELTAPSIEILTSNRDGFRDYSVRRVIDELTTKIAKDNLSALQSKRGMIRKKYEGSGRFKAKRAKGEVLEQIGPSGSKISSASLDRAADVLQSLISQGQGTLSGIPSKALMEVMLDQKFVGAAHIEAAIEQLVWQPDFYVMNDIEDWKIPKKFFPETMTPRVFKLAKTWVELCRFVMMQLGSDVYFGVGFHFNSSLAASAVFEKDKDEEEEKWLMLNPFKDLYERTDIWSPSQDADLKWLYAAVIHECTHIADRIEYHDESFAAALTRNMARCADGYRKIRQIVGEIRGRGGIEADEE